MRFLTHGAAIGLMVLTGAACNDSTSPRSESVRTQVLLTDAPFPFDLVRSVDVYIASVAAATTGDTTGAQVWTTIAEPRRTFNLLDLQDGRTAILGEGDLPTSTYGALRVVVDPARSGITLNNGMAAGVHWGATGPMSIHAQIAQPLILLTDEPTLVVDFDVGRSFQLLPGFSPGADQFQFVPWIRAVVAEATGAIGGTVRGSNGPTEVLQPVPHARITVFHAVPFQTAALTQVAATGRADAQGRYKIHFLSHGDYFMVVGPPTTFDAGMAVTGRFAVNAGETADLDVMLPPTDSVGNGSAAIFVSGPDVVTTGDTAFYFATVFGSAGDSILNPTVTWTSTNPAVATVASTVSHGGGTGTAILNAFSLGTTHVIAEALGASDSIFVTVVQRSDSTGGGGSGPVATVELTPVAQTVSVGDTAGVWATLKDAQGRLLSGRTVTWVLSDSTIVRFEFAMGQAAIMRALRSGTVTVTARSEGKSGTATVTVR